MPDERRPTPRSRVKPPSPSSPQRIEKVDLDWRAYFVEFCRVHGEPVEWDGRLLFRDGWTYSRTDYQGPEWPPPTDNYELDKIVQRYWETRRGTVEKNLNDALSKLERMTSLRQIKSIPLQQSVNVEGRKGYKPLDLSGLETRIGWLRDDLAECDTRLAEIESERIKNLSPPSKESA